MRRFRDHRYGRWQAETVMSMIKRRLGPAVTRRSDASRARGTMLKAITHNLMLIVGGLVWVFYRALPTPFSIVRAEAGSAVGARVCPPGRRSQHHHRRAGDR